MIVDGDLLDALNFDCYKSIVDLGTEFDFLLLDYWLKDLFDLWVCATSLYNYDDIRGVKFPFTPPTLCIVYKSFKLKLFTSLVNGFNFIFL